MAVLSRLDALQGIDRGALKAQAQDKRIKKRKAARAAAKATRAIPGLKGGADHGYF